VAIAVTLTLPGTGRMLPLGGNGIDAPLALFTANLTQTGDGSGGAVVYTIAFEEFLYVIVWITAGEQTAATTLVQIRDSEGVQLWNEALLHPAMTVARAHAYWKPPLIPMISQGPFVTVTTPNINAENSTITVGALAFNQAALDRGAFLETASRYLAR